MVQGWSADTRLLICFCLTEPMNTERHRTPSSPESLSLPTSAQGHTMENAVLPCSWDQLILNVTSISQLWHPHPIWGPLADHLQRVGNPAVSNCTPIYLLLCVGNLESGIALLHTLHAEVTHLGIRSGKGGIEAAGLLCYIYPSPYGRWERRLGDVCWSKEQQSLPHLWADL